MSAKKKYKHLFFDLDNTLWDFENNSREAMRFTFTEFNLMELSFELFFETYQKYNHQLWSDYRKKKVSKKDLTRLRFQQTFDELNITNVHPEKMNEVYLSVMPDQKLLNKGALEVLDYIKNKRLGMYIITNGFKEVQHKKLRSADLAKYFSKVFISEEIKTPKPGREIFEYAIKSVNAKKEESLMIGDDWEVDIMGAINVGIDAVYFSQNKYSLPKRKTSRIIYNVNDLLTLKNLI